MMAVIKRIDNSYGAAAGWTEAPVTSVPAFIRFAGAYQQLTDHQK